MSGEKKLLTLPVLLAGVSLSALAPPAIAQAQSAPQADKDDLQTIVVTARKRDESIAEVPLSITAFTAEALQDYNIQSFNDYATKTPNLSFSYSGGPTGISEARTVAIRGITGQNLTGTAGATGFYIDDTPIPGSVDPRVLDIDNIEVLKGPQGTLFGESSLGGNVRLITKKPELTQNDMGFMVDAGATSRGGSPDGGAGAVGNVVLVPGKMALRLVAFGDHEAGFLTRTYPTNPRGPGVSDPNLAVPRSSVDDQGAMTSFGGSATLLWRVTDNLDARFRLMAQQQTDYGFPAAFAPLPQFKPVYTIDRAFDVQPGALDRWMLPSFDLNYKGDGWSLVSATSYFDRYAEDREDSTYGTEAIIGPGYYQVNSGLPKQPYIWVGYHGHQQLTNETRFSWDPVWNLSGTLGVFYSKTHTKFWIPDTTATGLPAATLHNTVVGPWPNDLIWTQYNPGIQRDISLFGEVYYKFLDRFTLTVGAREYWLKQRSDYIADGFMNFGLTPSSPIDHSEVGFNPKLALSYQASDSTMLYGSASKGFRAGGAQSIADFCAEPGLDVNNIAHLRSDSLWTYEGGAKTQLHNPGLLISAAGFHIDWKNIQQQVSLPCGYYFTINGKEATINGGEIEISGRIAGGLTIHAGLGYEDAAISKAGALGAHGLQVRDGTRIFGVPDVTATIGAVYSAPINDTLMAMVSADYSYTGDSLSLLSGGTEGGPGGGGLQATRPAYSLVNARAALQWDVQEVSINARNLTNAKPNLGDIGYVGYAQFNSAGTVIPQVAVLQPLTVTVQYKYNF